MQISSSLLGNGLVAERRYDSSGRLVEKRYGSGYTFTCSLDNQGSVVRQDRVVKGEAGTAVFQYDTAGHLITDADTVSSEDLFFTYDAVGNRLTRQSSAGSVNEIYSYQQNGNRLQGIDAIAIEYDAAGNILNDGICSFRYNTMNRLAEANHSQLKIPAYYTYNYLGQRVRKQLSDGQGTDIRYVYGQSGELLGEYDASGSRIREYVYFTNGNIQELVAQIEADGSLTYIHTDHLATPRSATNQSQTIVWSWISDAFGEAAPNEDVDGDGVLVTVNQRFPGQYFDNETGLHYNWHRFYDPSTGRYITADPIGLDGGMNLYAYVQNDPVNWIDPWGLTRVGSAIGGTIGSVVGGWGGSIVGGAVGAAGGTVVAPGVGTVGLGAAGADAGGIAGAAGGALLGAYLGDKISDALGPYFSKKSGKEKASDIPSWAAGQKPMPGESGKDFADRLLKDKYGEGCYPKGPGSEHNKLKKYGDRSR